jgi:hypothetical protein
MNLNLKKGKMMETEQRNNIKTAYYTLVRYNLWRKDFTDNCPDVKDISFAVDVACGVLIDFLAVKKENKIIRKSLSAAEKALEENENLVDSYQDRFVDQAKKRHDAEKEVKRLRSLLAAHKIKYAKK